MAEAVNERHYTSVAKALHWSILVLMIVQFILGWIMPHIGRNTPVTTLIGLHFSFGVVILAVAFVRLGWRFAAGEPEPEDGLPLWQQQSARLMHWALYMLLFVVPILGWINASWRGMPVALFGYELPKLVATRAPGWGWTGDVHGLLADYAMLVLIGLHVAAALYHHFILGDRVLKRMLPATIGRTHS